MSTSDVFKFIHSKNHKIEYVETSGVTVYPSAEAKKHSLASLISRDKTIETAYRRGKDRGTALDVNSVLLKDLYSIALKTQSGKKLTRSEQNKINADNMRVIGDTYLMEVLKPSKDSEYMFAMLTQIIRMFHFVSTENVEVWQQPIDIGNLLSKFSSNLTVKPVGWGELMTVQRTPLRYEATEIAHIENVMATESKEHKNLFSTEEETETVIETVIDEKETKDEESTLKNGLETAVDSTITKDNEKEFGTKIAGKYGPVTMEVNGNLSSASSSTSQKSSSESFAKEIVERSTKSLQKQTLNRRTTRSKTFQSKEVVHGFDNSENEADVVGLYRWVEKVNCMQILNYGKRLMFDINIPEPAAHLKWLKSSQEQVEADNKPEWGSVEHNGSWSDLTINDIDDNSWDFWASYFGVEVQPPPPQEMSVQTIIDENWMQGNETDPPLLGGDSSGDSLGATYPSVKQGSVKIPDGYEAIEVIVPGIGNSPYGTTHYSGAPRLVIGQKLLTNIALGNTVKKDLNNEVGELPVGVHKFYRVASYSISVEVVCKRSSNTFETWRLQTFNSFVRAYETKVAEWEQKNLMLQRENAPTALQEAIAVTPQRLEDTMRIELKRSTIMQITGNTDFFSQFNSVTQNGVNKPDVDLSETYEEGALIEFIERAFEWENMTFLFYPYIWAKETEWKTMLESETVSRDYTAFMNAGAARVVVPVRPEFAEAVAFFQTTGVPWFGNDVPDIDDPLYMSIVDVIRNQTADYDKICQVGSSWETREPTGLVVLDGKRLPVLAESCPQIEGCS